MKIIIYILIAVLAISCSAKKKVTNRTKERTSVSVKKDVAIQQQNNIKTNATLFKKATQITYTPANKNKPMVVNGVETINAIINIKTDTLQYQKTKTDSSFVSAKDKSGYNKKQSNKNNTSNIETSRTPVWMWVTLAIVMCFGLYFFRRWAVFSSGSS